MASIGRNTNPTDARCATTKFRFAKELKSSLKLIPTAQICGASEDARRLVQIADLYKQGFAGFRLATTGRRTAVAARVLTSEFSPNGSAGKKNHARNQNDTKCVLKHSTSKWVHAGVHTYRDIEPLLPPHSALTNALLNFGRRKKMKTLFIFYDAVWSAEYQ